MGEKNAKGESILGGFHEKGADLVKDICLSNTINFAHLHSFNADNLKYVHSKALRYDKCNFSPTLEAALIVKKINGDAKYA